MKLLIADDDRDIVSFYKTFLESKDKVALKYLLNRYLAEANKLVSLMSLLVRPLTRLYISSSRVEKRYNFLKIVLEC